MAREQLGEAQSLSAKHPDFQKTLWLKLAEQQKPHHMERFLAESAPGGFKISAMLAQRLRQTRMKIVKTAQIKFRGIFQAVIPLRVRDFLHERGKLTQQPALRGTLLPIAATAFDEPDDFHFTRDIWRQISNSAVQSFRVFGQKPVGVILPAILCRAFSVSR